MRGGLRGGRRGGREGRIGSVRVSRVSREVVSVARFALARVYLIHLTSNSISYLPNCHRALLLLLLLLLLLDQHLRGGCGADAWQAKWQERAKPVTCLRSSLLMVQVQQRVR